MELTNLQIIYKLSEYEHVRLNVQQVKSGIQVYRVEKLDLLK